MVDGAFNRGGTCRPFEIGAAERISDRSCNRYSYTADEVATPTGTATGTGPGIGADTRAGLVQDSCREELWLAIRNMKERRICAV